MAPTGAPSSSLKGRTLTQSRPHAAIGILGVIVRGKGERAEDIGDDLHKDTINFFGLLADTSYGGRSSSSFRKTGGLMAIPNLRAKEVILGFLAVGLSAFGCAHTVVVEVPPKINLQAYKTIGILEFSSDSRENLNQIATQKFMGFIQDAQPQVRFLELGPEDQLLRELGRNSLDTETIEAIGKKYGVSSIFTGSFEISNMIPNIRMGTDLSSIRASANVKISMVSRHWDTANGATIWSKSRQGQWKVAGINSNAKDISFSMKTPESEYGRYLEDLAFALTDNFRPHYEKRDAPK
jgi:hypothetical protein